MTPDLAATLMDLYDRAADAAGRDDIDAAAILVTEAGAILAAPPAPPPEDPASRAAMASLAEACDQSRRACAAAVEAARTRLQLAAATDLRAASVVGHYGDQGAPDARFIDRRS